MDEAEKWAKKILEADGSMVKSYIMACERDVTYNSANSTEVFQKIFKILVSTNRIELVEILENQIMGVS